MKKKLTAFFMAFLMFIVGSFSLGVDVRAEDIEGEDVDISEIMTDDALIGYAEMQTWGVYLMEGMSTINDAGSGKIGAGGITTAAKRCTVSTNAIIERKVNGTWVHVTSWTVTKTNALTATASKTLSVTGGYWYRCRCVHRASSDVSNSYTGALWM